VLIKGLCSRFSLKVLTGRPYLGKPGLDQSYLNKAGEFEIKEQPGKIEKAITEVWVSPEAYKGLRKAEKIMFDRYLGNLEKSGISVNKVDKLPNAMD
jgi:hypothetical protein